MCEWYAWGILHYPAGWLSPFRRVTIKSLHKGTLKANLAKIGHATMLMFRPYTHHLLQHSSKPTEPTEEANANPVT